MRVGAGAKTDIMDVKPQRIALVAGLDSLRYGYGREAANTRDDAERSRIAKDRAKNTLFTNDYVKTLPDHHPLNYEEGMVDTRVENELANRDKAKTTAEMAARGLMAAARPSIRGQPSRQGTGPSRSTSSTTVGASSRSPSTSEPTSIPRSARHARTRPRSTRPPAISSPDGCWLAERRVCRRT
jgi:hypothetical protein